MWCQNCKSEVTTKLGEDGQSLICNSCGATTTISNQASATNVTQSAHDLLKKWDTKQAEISQPASQSIPDSIDVEDAVRKLEQEVQSATKVPQKPKMNDETVQNQAFAQQKPQVTESANHLSLDSQKSVAATVEKTATKRKTQVSNIDSSSPINHPKADTAIPKLNSQNRLKESNNLKPQTQSPPASVTPTPVPQQGKLQFGHAQPLDEMEIQRSIKRRFRRKKNWSAVFGQMLCYLGALGMTCGGAGLVGIYYGSLEFPETTGWLTIIGGQLIFFVGLATSLIARSEQTLTDIHARCDELSELAQQQEQLLKTQQNHLDQMMTAQLSASQQAESRLPKSHIRKQETLPV